MTANRPIRVGQILVMLSFCGAIMLAQNSGTPRFEDYPVTEVFSGTPAAPILSTSKQRMNRTRIRNGVLKGEGVFRDDGTEGPGPNFAGHYIVVQIMCGAPCTLIFVVDAKTGIIYPPPIAEGSDVVDKLFHVTSRLFEINGWRYDKAGDLKPSSTYYFLWEADAWKLLRRVPIP
jgi:hypothetical protein